MSCFAYMPGLYTLDYWHEKYKGKIGHKRFLLTKLIEVVSFKFGQETYAAPKMSEKPLFPLVEIDNCIPENPKICVVVPCFVKNNKDRMCLKRLLGALVNQHVLADVIIVDDASPLAVSSLYGEHIVRLDQNSGPAAARNMGIMTALNKNADMIVFTDMDCIPEENWLSVICNAFKSSRSIHVVSGKTKSFGDSWLDKYHNMNGTLNGRFYQGHNKLLYGTTCNLALSKVVVENIQFSESFPLAAGEDIEFCYRINEAGYNIHYIESAVIAHDYFYNSDSFFGRWKSFVRQFRKYAHGEKLLLKSVPNYYEYYAHSESITVK